MTQIAKEADYGPTERRILSHMEDAANQEYYQRKHRQWVEQRIRDKVSHNLASLVPPMKVTAYWRAGLSECVSGAAIFAATR